MFSLDQILGWYKGAMKARTIPAEATSATPATCETLEGRRLLSATPVYQAWEATEQNTHEAFDITRTYTDGSNQPATFSQAFGAGNPALNLTLENVPAHAVISFGFVLQTNAEHQTQNDSDNLTVSVAGQQIFSADVSYNDYFVYGGAGPINHTGGTLPITFSTSGFDSNESCSIVEMNVSVYLPTITTNPSSVTVGEDETATVTVDLKDEFGTTIQDTIDVVSSDDGVATSSVATIAPGGTIEISGVSGGTANIQLTAGGGYIDHFLPVKVGALKWIVAENHEVPVRQGRQLDVTLIYENTVTNEQWPAVDKTLTLIPLHASYNAVFINNNAKTDDNGVVHIWVTGLANNDGGEPLIIKYQWNWDKQKSVAVNVDVTGI